MKIPVKNIMIAANCSNCVDGTPIDIHEDVDGCPNITPNFTADHPVAPTACEGDASTKVHFHRGDNVFWRYVTLGPKYRNFVLIRNSLHHPTSEPDWLFIPRRGLRDDLCGRRTGCGEVPPEG